MLRKYKITYVAVNSKEKKPKHHEVEIVACSKYDAKQKFYFQYPKYDIVKVEVEE